MLKTSKGPQPRRVTIVRYYDVEGKLCKKSTPGAQAVKTQSKTFYAWLRVNGKYGPVPLKTEDIGQAWVELRKLQRREADRRAGIVDDL